MESVPSGFDHKTKDWERLWHLATHHQSDSCQERIMRPNHQQTRTKTLDPMIDLGCFFRFLEQGVHLSEQLIDLWEIDRNGPLIVFSIPKENRQWIIAPVWWWWSLLCHARPKLPSPHPARVADHRAAQSRPARPLGSPFPPPGLPPDGLGGPERISFWGGFPFREHTATPELTAAQKVGSRRCGL